MDLTPWCQRPKNAALAPNPYGHTDDEEPRIEITKPIWDMLRGNMLKDILAYHGFWDHEVGQMLHVSRDAQEQASLCFVSGFHKVAWQA